MTTAESVWLLSGNSLIGEIFRIGIDVGGEGDFCLFFCISFISLYFHPEGFFRYSGKERETGISIHDWGVWFHIWQDAMEWNPKRDWWHSFNLNIPDFLFGRMDYSEHTLSEEDGEVPMPEKSYPCTVKIFESIWKRKRFPFWPFTRKIIRSNVDIKKGSVPFPGKGENSWDCGMNGTSASTAPHTTYEAAIGGFVSSVLRNRRKYGGKNWKVEEEKI